MKKVIKIDESNYKQLLAIIHNLETVNNKRMSFDDVVSLLLEEHKNTAKNK